jgi:hypothetical protein
MSSAMAFFIAPHGTLKSTHLMRSFSGDGSADAKGLGGSPLSSACALTAPGTVPASISAASVRPTTPAVIFPADKGTVPPPFSAV